MSNLDHVCAAWNRLGATFSGPVAGTTPDVERLLLDTAAVLPQSARLFSMVLGWLNRYEKLVCSHRLAVLAQSISDEKQSACLGYLLTMTKAIGGSHHYGKASKACHPLEQAEPLFDAYISTSGLWEIAEQSSTPEALAWGLWAPPARPYLDGLRAPEWIMKHNPDLHQRALFGGRLPASVIVTLTLQPEAGASESALARATSATRDSVRDALDHLELCRFVTRTHEGRNVAIRLTADGK